MVVVGMAVLLSMVDAQPNVNPISSNVNQSTVAPPVRMTQDGMTMNIESTTMSMQQNTGGMITSGMDPVTTMSMQGTNPTMMPEQTTTEVRRTIVTYVLGG